MVSKSGFASHCHNTLLMTDISLLPRIKANVHFCRCLATGSLNLACWDLNVIAADGEGNHKEGVYPSLGLLTVSASEWQCQVILIYDWLEVHHCRRIRCARKHWARYNE